MTVNNKQEITWEEVMDLLSNPPVEQEVEQLSYEERIARLSSSTGKPVGGVSSVKPE